ncbi:hypothetical protein DL98DRAFT_595656 [Cadophora sp. DSE1049]|nr:hypothetical protein DL98DRAFT_595656 [Cadophora sp. DSE1049]
MAMPYFASHHSQVRTFAMHWIPWDNLSVATFHLRVYFEKLETLVVVYKERAGKGSLLLRDADEECERDEGNKVWMTAKRGGAHGKERPSLENVAYMDEKREKR